MVVPRYGLKVLNPRLHKSHEVLRITRPTPYLFIFSLYFKTQQCYLFYHLLLEFLLNLMEKSKFPILRLKIDEIISLAMC